MFCSLVAVAMDSSADQCESFGEAGAAIVREEVRPGAVLVHLCEPCGMTEPLPLRVKRVELVADPLASQPNRFQLRVNGERVDLAYLYGAAEGNTYRNLGTRAECGVTDVRAVIEYEPIARDPALMAPPAPFVVDITGRCFDGSCPGERWIATGDVPLHASPEPRAETAATLRPGERVSPLRLQTSVQPVSVRVVHDHGRFFAGDELFLLNSLGEGHFNVWFYGKVYEEDVSGTSPFSLGPPRDGCAAPSKDCWGEAAGLPDEVWWAEVRRENGQTGWVREPERVLEGVLVDD